MISSRTAVDQPDVARRLVIHSITYAWGEAAVLLTQAEEECREADAEPKQLVEELVMQL